jgi:hypothetical protein
MKKLIAAVILVTSASTAFAGVTTYVDEAAKYLVEVKSGKKVYRSDWIAQCAEPVSRARAANDPIPPHIIYKNFGGKPVGDKYAITYDQADAICREASYYRDVVFKDLDLFKDLDSKINMLVTTDWSMENKDTMSTDYLTKLGESCEQAVAVMTAAKIPASAPFKLDYTGVNTIGELQTKLCDRAKDVGQNYWKRRVEAEAKSKEPYVKAGIKGDKLDLMLEYDGSIFLTGKRAPDGLKPYAAASTMFTWSTSDPDDNDYVIHTVRKYLFKGNNLVRTSEKTFRKRRGEELGAAAFK